MADSVRKTFKEKPLCRRPVSDWPPLMRRMPKKGSRICPLEASE
jgi:hypothetical protein